MGFRKAGFVCAALAWLAVSGGPGLAEGANPCADATTTIAMRECLDKAYTSADAALNAVWKQVMAHVSDADHMPAKERKVWKDELLELQRAWI